MKRRRGTDVATGLDHHHHQPLHRRHQGPLLLLAIPLLLLLLAATASAFVITGPVLLQRAQSKASSMLAPLLAKKAAGGKKAGKGGSGGGGGPSTAKGFGSMGGGASGGSSSKAVGGAAGAEAAVEIMKDRATLELMDWVAKNGGQVNNLAVARVGGIRGVVALKPFRKGETIISIPYELALDVTSTAPGAMTTKLGPGDPVFAAIELWKRLDDPSVADFYKPYLSILPPPAAGADADAGTEKEVVTGMSTTDFFTEEELALLEWGPTQEETRRRLARTAEAAASAGKSLAEMKWAVWMVVSRSLGVAGSVAQRQVLIPFLDLCNHKATSKHVLTGRAVAGGQLKVTAGADVAVGEEINFAYGGGCLTSDRFVQDYGFLDAEEFTRDWDRRTLAAGLKAKTVSLTDLEAFVASAPTTPPGTLTERGRMAVDFAGRMRRAAEEALRREKGGAAA